MRNVLVTGGLGFVGSHLVEALLGEGCRITIVDNLLSNVVPPEHFQGRCQVLCEAIEESEHRLTLDSVAKFDEIYHLASVVGPAGVLQHAGDIARMVIHSGDVVKNLALMHNARLLLASTSEVYGQTGNLKEDLDCIVGSYYTVRLEYAVAKLASEVAALNKAKVCDLQVNVVRPFNISGPRQLPDGGFVLPRFVVSALLGVPLTVFCEGKQIRAFTDVRDIVSGLMAVMKCPQTGQVFNLGNPANEVTIGDLALAVVKAAESQSPITLVDPKVLFGPLYEEGIERSPNVEKALSMLDWRPKYSLTQTIEDTIQFYRSRPDLVKLEELEKVSS